MTTHEDPNGAEVRVRGGVVDVLVMQPVNHGPKNLLETLPMAVATADSMAEAEHQWRVLTLRRAVNVRCTGAWEIVHGGIEPGERPVDAAVRELHEETGLTVDRLYSLNVNPFYLHTTNTVQLAIGFIAIVAHDAVVTLGIEHDAWAWPSPLAAQNILAWPRSHDAIRHAVHILRTGDAGAVDDVLRVR